MTKNNNKGQGLVSSVGALISLGFMIVIALVIIGNLENSTLGTCYLNGTVVTNDTDSANVSEFFHGFALSSPVIGSTAFGNVSIGSDVFAADGESVSDCQVLVGGGGSWTSLGYITNTTPRHFNFTTAQIGASMNINYSTCTDININQTNISYNALLTCDYTYDAYDALTTTTSMTYSGMNIIPIAVVVFAAITVISTLYLLISKT